MADTKKIFSSVEIVEVPVQVEVPVYTRKEMPEYVLVKEEVVYKVPRVEYENKTYEKPVYVEKEFIIPKYVTKEYEIPVYREKVYEVPKIVEIEKQIELPKITIYEDVREVYRDVEIKVPKIIKEDVRVTNAVITDVNVTNAIIKHQNVDAIHPTYLCAKCKTNKVDPVSGK
jgi:hypothetical protein